ncbi:chromosome segregation protein SMC [Arthrobacter sp. Leaf337]|uniref:AAA family ATPase n=1 Tax=Arthrobacter sp. Leaf337 TaxID=1736342 RepID=UPI0006F97015|nr:SMC family ATPase [Arthrobacter sp. Leaf337]KQR82575.1 chromosome segregation protein SMC [Arthrobacter sp. Leaf337]
MRIHRLEISAFGPFAGTEHIDFDRLSSHGLFLLNGATGAGKTSVLDAICFALYGSVPGARQEGKRLRSDHADAAAEPRVTCEFSAKGRHFEVSRIPAWNRPSARGKNGFTEQKANTLLRERVDGQWMEKSGRNDEAGAEISSVLGMDREQFTRVVMLPQGDFAAFLRSKPSDRLELLQSLFGTQRFEAVEQELARQAAEARTEVSGLNNQLDLLLAQARAEAAPSEEDLPDAFPVPDDADHLLAWLQDTAAARAGILQAEADQAAAARAEAARRLESAAARAARQAKLAAAELRKSAADAAAPELGEKTRQLGLHRRAEVLGGQLQAVDKAEDAEERAAGAMAAAAAELNAAVLLDPELAALATGGGAATSRHPAGSEDEPYFEAAVMRSELSRLRSLRAVLEERLPDEARLSGMAVRSTELRSTVEKLREGWRAGAAALDALRAEMAGLLAGLAPLEELAAEAQLRTKEAAAAEELVAVVGRYATAARLCFGVDERHRIARDDQQNHRQRWLDLREERLANAAAELASQLRPAAPCPVCGSPEHPSPAPAATAALAIAEAEQAAQEACEAAEAVLATLDKELAEARQQVAVLAAQGGDTAAEDARAEAAMAKERAREAVRAAVELVASRERLAELDEQVAAAESTQAATDSSIATTESTHTEVLEQAAALEATLQKLRAGYPTLGSRLTSLNQSTALLERTDAARTSLEQAMLRTTEARQVLDQALPESGFASAEAARAVLLPAPEAATLEAAIRAGQDEAARVGELFAGEELTQAARELAADGPVEPGVLEELRAEDTAAEQAARQAVIAAGLADKSVQTICRIAGDYTRLAASGQGPRERAALLTAVADAARGAGDNSYRMSLNSYVLAARLEQVAIAASERLVGMSDGRYTLQHTDAKAARGAKSGLGLEVVDQWTGQRRDTSTLSGGESFMASLALALGLADVVQQESGGVDIETLFVDEGFGSLDEQALEQVMDALEGLRDGGRVVGLVSHVPEMKQRISTQLQVVKGRNGSTLHISDDAPA